MMKILHYLSKNQFSIQSIIFWIVAITQFSTERFWYFATAAIIFRGIQDILKELRILNKNNKNNENDKS